MKRINKFTYLYVIQAYYGRQYGWEDIDQSESRKEAMTNYRLYNREEKGYQHRIIERREINPEKSIRKALFETYAITVR